MSFLLLCLGLAGLFAGLGVWQVERMGWKHDLIARVEARRHAAPIAPPPSSRWRPDAAYTRVSATGVFLHDRESLVQAVTERGPGFWVMTPLDAGDRLILVNRGFVPPDRRIPASRAAGQTTGAVRVTGLLRASEPGGGFLRRNAPGDDRWYSRDVAAIAVGRGLGAPVAPYFIDADATPNPGGYPVGGLTVVKFRDSHLIYALTWFGLSVLSMGGAAFVWRTPRRA